MQPPLRDEEKKKIIDHYLHGVKVQSVIALLVGRSEGTVSNVIRRFLNEAGEQNIDAIRQLIVAMSEAGVHADDCVRGFRMIQILSKLGITLDDEKDISWIIKLESFIEKVYKEAKSIGIPGDQIVEYAKQLLEVSKNKSIDPACVTEFCESKQKQLDEISEELKELEHRRKKAMKDCDVTEADLKQFTYVREELKKHNLAIDNIPKLVNTLKNTQQLGHNASRIAAELSEVESIEKKKQDDINLDLAISNEIAEHNKELDAIKKQLAAESETLSELNQLKDMGCGPDQLRVLKETISGIVAASELVVELGVTDSNKSTLTKLAPGQAFRKFFLDVEKHYDKLLGFEYYADQEARLQTKVQELSSRIAILEQVRDSFIEGVEKLKSAVTDLRLETNVIESCKAEVAETKQAFNDLRKATDAIYDKTVNIAVQCNTAIENSTQRYDTGVAVLKYKAGKLDLVIRALAGEHFEAEQLVRPVKFSLDAIIPRLRRGGYRDAQIKCEEARHALERILETSQ